jgi:hypothetical protein
MRSVLSLITLLLFTGLSAQDSAHVVKNYRNGNVDEDYYLNAAGNKNGKYIRYNRNGKVYIQGQYKNGSPAGIWNFYSADTSAVLVQTLNFDTKKETYLDSLRAPSLLCGPRYFGGNMLKQEYVQQRIKSDFTAAERAQLKGKTVMAVFEIDSVTYRPFGITIDDISITQDMRTKMIKIINEMPTWLPPVCRQNAVWRMSVVFLFE